MTACDQIHERAARVTKEMVFDAIKAYAEGREKPFFTTRDIAIHMGVEEYPVRSTFSWLTRNKFIEIVPGVRTRRYRPGASKRRWDEDWYSVSVYQVVEKCAAADFNTLNRVFCGG